MRQCLYAFDVDETLEVSNGPVTLAMLASLRSQGHIVGLCGNWAKFVQTIPLTWQYYVSFISCSPVSKAEFLRNLRQYIPADDYIMVGNVYGQPNSLGFVCGSKDSEAAAEAGWRFIKEDDFAQGVR